MIRSLDGVSPRVHPTAFVSEFSYVVGDVEIGEGSSVWPGSVVRGDMGKVTLGRNTCVQDNSVELCGVPRVLLLERFTFTDPPYFLDVVGDSFLAFLPS